MSAAEAEEVVRNMSRDVTKSARSNGNCPDSMMLCLYEMKAGKSFSVFLSSHNKLVSRILFEFGMEVGDCPCVSVRFIKQCEIGLM